MTDEQTDIISNQYTKSDTITFEDEKYIQKHLSPLYAFSKDTALKLYLKQIKEPQKITELKTQYSKNTQLLEKNLQRLKSVEGNIANKQFQTEQEFAWLDRVNAFRTHLLSYLPRCYYKEGETFINRFILENHQEEYKEIATPPQSLYVEPHTNYAPGMHPQHQTLHDKIKRFYYNQPLQKFYDEFVQKNAEYKEFEPRYDITIPITKLKEDILNKFDTSTLLQERERINKEIERLSSENEELNQALNQTQASLILKRERFLSYYDKQLFYTDYEDETVSQAIQNNQLIGNEEQQQYLKVLLNTLCEYSELGRDIIHQCLKIGTSYELSIPNNTQQTHSTYKNGKITLPDLTPSPHQAYSILTRIIYESKHALQDAHPEFTLYPSICNRLLQISLKERDALAATCAVSHDLKDIYPQVYQTMLSKAPYMQRAYTQSIQETKDIIHALNKTALAWDKDFGEYCKRLISDHPLEPSPNQGAEISDDIMNISPEIMIEKYNICTFDKPYLDLSEATQKSLTVTDDVYARLTILNQIPSQIPTDNSLDYINRQTQNKTTQKDIYGLRITKAKQISAPKHFTISPIKPTAYHYTNLPIRTYSFETLLEQIAQLSSLGKSLQEYANEKHITFTKTRGLTEDLMPRPALYNSTNNSIIFNQSYTKDEQILSFAEIILSLQLTLLPPEFKIKSQLIYANLCQAEQITKLYALATELSSQYPLILQKLNTQHPHIQTSAPEQIFISSLKDPKIRHLALTYLEQQLPINNQEKKTDVYTIAPTEIVKLFAENLPLSGNIKNIAQMARSVTNQDFQRLRLISAIWQDTSIKDLRLINSYEEL